MRIDIIPFALIVVFSAIGIAIAGIMEVMHDSGFILDEFISGTITLADLQIIVIVFSIIIGLILAVTKK